VEANQEEEPQDERRNALLRRAIAAHVATYARADGGSGGGDASGGGDTDGGSGGADADGGGGGAPPSKRPRRDAPPEKGAGAGEGEGAARRRHAAQLVAGELEIWTAAAEGGRRLLGREAAAAVAGSRARQQRLETP
tara:strand:+ start:502 stop:912 length:411 start_codon:yes stop_codon:yes gene_type:complete